MDVRKLIIGLYSTVARNPVSSHCICKLEANSNMYMPYIHVYMHLADLPRYEHAQLSYCWRHKTAQFTITNVLSVADKG